MNLTELLIQSILESTKSVLQVSNLKLNNSLNEENVEKLFGETVNLVSEKVDEETEVDWTQVVKALEEDSDFDKVFADITGILTSIENIEEETVAKSVELLAKGIELAASNISEQYDSKVEKAVEEMKTSLEEEIKTNWEEATKEWADKKEQELKEALEYSPEEVELFKKAGTFVLALEAAFKDANLSFDEALTEKITALEETNKELSEEVAEFKKEQGRRVKDDIFNNVTEGLTDFEKDKLKSLSEGLVFITDEDYEKKLTEMKDAFKSVKKEEDDEDDKDHKKKKDDKESIEESSRKKLGEEVSRLLGANL